MKDPPTCKIRDCSVFFVRNTQQVPPRMEGPFLWMCPYLLKVKKQVVHHPRCK